MREQADFRTDTEKCRLIEQSPMALLYRYHQDPGVKPENNLDELTFAERMLLMERLNKFAEEPRQDDLHRNVRLWLESLQSNSQKAA